MPRAKEPSERTRVVFTIADAEVGAILRLISDRVQDLEVHAVTDVPYHRNRPRNGGTSQALPALTAARSDVANARLLVKEFREALLDRLAVVGPMSLDDIYQAAGGMPKQTVYSLLHRMKFAGELKQPEKGTYALKGKAARKKTKKSERSAPAKRVARKLNGRSSAPNRFAETGKKFILRLLAKGSMTGAEIGKAGEAEGRSSNAVQVELPKLMREHLITKEKGPDGKNLYSLMEAN